MWLEKGERGERGERGRRGEEGVAGAGHAAPVDLREDVHSYLEGGGSPGGLWVDKGRGLTAVLAGALWWLLRGGQAMGSWLEPGRRLETAALVRVGDEEAEPRWRHRMGKKL